MPSSPSSLLPEILVAEEILANLEYKIVSLQITNWGVIFKAVHLHPSQKLEDMVDSEIMSFGIATGTALERALETNSLFATLYATEVERALQPTEKAPRYSSFRVEGQELDEDQPSEE